MSKLSEYTIDAEQIKKYYELLNHQGSTEIRLIPWSWPKKKGNFAISQFPKTAEEMIDVCKEFSGTYNVYAGINQRHKEGKGNSNVIEIQTFALDVDAVRSDDTLTEIDDEGKKIQRAASDEELKACWDYLEDEVLPTLEEEFGRPSIIMSGNGYQLLWKFEPILINSLEENEKLNLKLRWFLREFIERFSSPVAEIDRTGDLARVMKVPGVYSIKGFHTDKTPHRMAKILEINLEHSPKIREGLLATDEKGYLLKKRETKPNKSNGAYSFKRRDAKVEAVKKKVTVAAMLEKYGYESGGDRVKCPFGEHSTDDTFRIFKRTNSWYCYGTGCCFGGDAVTLFMRFEGVGYREAKRQLMEEYGVAGFVEDEEKEKLKNLSFHDRKQKIIEESLKKKEQERLMKEDFFEVYDESLDFETCKQLTKEHLNEGVPKFVLSNEVDMEGKVMLLESEAPVELLMWQKGFDKEYNSLIFFQNDKISRDVTIEETVTFPFYHYMLVNKKNKYHVFLKDKPQPGKYQIKGNFLPMTENKAIGETAKAQLKMPILLAHHAELKSLKFNNVAEVIDLFKGKDDALQYYKDSFFVQRATEIRDDKILVVQFPDELKEFLLVFLFHEKYSGWPMHIHLMGAAGLGKTMFLDMVEEYLGDPYCTGAETTLRGLGVSHKTSDFSNKGFLRESMYVAGIDEFTNLIARNLKDGTDVDNIFNFMNSVLEHKNAHARSGNGEGVADPMTARAVLMSNYLGKNNKLSDFQACMNNLSAPWLSRFITINMDGEIETEIRRMRLDEMYRDPKTLLDSESIGAVVLFMQQQRVKYNPTRIKEIHRKIVASQKIPFYVTKEILARFDHHLWCIIDGVVKLRCLREKSEVFVANEIDYNNFEKMVEWIISTWSNRW